MGFVRPAQGPGSLQARRFLVETLPWASSFEQARMVRAHALMYALVAENLELAEHDVACIVGASGADSWDAAQARKSLAQALLAASKCKLAVAVLRQTLESQAPADEIAMSRVMLAEAYEKLGDRPRMIEQLEFVLYGHDESLKFVFVAKSVAAERLGKYYLHGGDAQRALKHFTAWVPTGECGTCVALANARKRSYIANCREAISRQRATRSRSSSRPTAGGSQDGRAVPPP
jgi:tetratricopeptide (TPR) repeat protein